MKLNFNLTNRLNSFTLKAVLVSAFVAGGTLAQAQNSYTWDGSAGDNSWSNPLNWTPERTSPGTPNDVLEINGNITSAPVVNLDFAAASELVGGLYVINGAQATFRVASNKTLNIGNSLPYIDFRVEAGSKLTVNNSVAGAALSLVIVPASNNNGYVYGELEFRGDYGNAAHKIIGTGTSPVWFYTNSKFIAATGFTGHAFGSATGSKVTFIDGANYINEAGAHPFGSGASPAVSFGSGSIYTHRSLDPIQLCGRIYSKLVVDNAGYSATPVGVGSLKVDDIVVNQATSVVIPMDGTSNYIYGNIEVNSGTLTFTSSIPGTTRNLYFHGDNTLKTVSTSGSGKIIMDDLCKTTVSVDRSIKMSTNLILRGTFTVLGSLDLENYTISTDIPSPAMSGSFAVGNGASFSTSHAQGIYKYEPLGCILVTKNRGFGNSNYRYYGNTAQQTGLGLPTITQSLTIDNPASVTLSANVKVTSALKLLNGILYSNSNQLMTVDHTATISGSGNTKFVSGPLAIVVAQTTPDKFQFPIGKGNDYRPVSLTVVHNDSTPTTYTAELHLDAPIARTLPSSLKMVSSTRYFKISKSPDAALVSGYITMPFSQDEGMGVLYPEAVHIAKSNGTVWMDLGGNYSQAELNITSSNSFTTFSDFVFARTSATLPVSLISLDAASEKENVLVNWATSKEENNDYFEVQRSTDGQHFQTIGKVEGMGNSANENNYAFIDYQPLSGLAYYRLRQVDFDGTASFHGPVAVRRATGSIGQLALYPNPAVGSTTLTFEAETDQVATIRVVNTIGQTVAQQSVSATKGLNSVTVPASQLATGMYIVEMITESGTTAARLIKQ